jgi:hypothetical protein
LSDNFEIDNSNINIKEKKIIFNNNKSNFSGFSYSREDFQEQNNNDNSFLKNEFKNNSFYNFYNYKNNNNIIINNPNTNTNNINNINNINNTNNNINNINKNNEEKKNNIYNFNSNNNFYINQFYFNPNINFNNINGSKYDVSMYCLGFYSVDCKSLIKINSYYFLLLFSIFRNTNCSIYPKKIKR